ncbi:MAG: hypothetical protein FWC89_10920 [Defluviitaleaceae bacterium]|nr:hypothetical protein [Defluviitaleaceae bacterium]
MKYALGVFVLFPILLFVPLMLTGDIIWLIHAPAMMGYLLVLVAVLVVTGEFKIFVKSVNALLSKKYNISSEEIERGIKLFEVMKKSVILAGVFFTAGATMSMLRDLQDFHALGPMIAILLILVLYAAMINLVFILPAIYILKARQAAEAKLISINEKEVVSKLLELCYKHDISPEEILNASEVTFQK